MGKTKPINVPTGLVDITVSHTEGDRSWLKNLGQTARRQFVGNTAAFYLRRSAIHERGEDTSIMAITVVLTGETVHYKTKT